jgi:uncharacterized protein (DUF2236 family)
LHQLHTRIHGTLPDAIAAYPQGSGYDANQVRALQWVYATLIESALMAYQSVLPELSARECEAFYQESCVLAQLFGIPLHALPRDWSDFGSYMQSMVSSQSLGVDERSRSMAKRLLAGAGSRIHPPGWYRALTVAWLPARFREEFALPLGPPQQRAAEKAQARLQRWYRCLPPRLRFVGPFHQAQDRLAARPPGLLTRASNQFWIGASLLPFSRDPG